MNTATFARNHNTGGTCHRNSSAFTFGKGGNQPPKKTVTATHEMMIMAVYSPRKKNANFTPEYSVLKPETSSDSASGRSKGLRFVSAMPDTKYRKKARSPGKTNQRWMRSCRCTISTR